MPLDSFEKIATSYLPAVTKVPFTYKKTTYQPSPLRVSPMIFRGFECVAMCGGCCQKITIDFLPSDPHPYELKPREIVFNGKSYTLFSDLNQDSAHDHFCKHLNVENGRCGLHAYYPNKGYPFSCDFELLRFYIERAKKPSEDGRVRLIKRKSFNKLNHAPFGRAWNMLTVEGTRGAKCIFKPESVEEVKTVVRKLRRLQEWCNYFEIDSVVPEIIAWAEKGPNLPPLWLNQEKTFTSSEGKKMVPLPLFPVR